VRLHDECRLIVVIQVTHLVRLPVVDTDTLRWTPSFGAFTGTLDLGVSDERLERWDVHSADIVIVDGLQRRELPQLYGTIGVDDFTLKNEQKQRKFNNTWNIQNCHNVEYDQVNLALLQLLLH